jgi:hypothetical protein
MAYGTLGSQQHQGLGAPTKNAQELRLDSLINRFEKSLSELQSLQMRNGNIADRILGSAPEEASQGQPPAPSATLGKIEALQENLDYLLSRLRHSVDRLETL